MSLAKILQGGAIAFATAASLWAIPASELKENYQSIIERNPFGLKPPVVAPPVTNKPPEAPKPKNDIFLTGITAIGAPRVPKRAYFMIKEQGAKEPKYRDMTEGQELEGMAVLNIDEKLRTVKIRTPEGELLLDFVKNALPASAAPVAQPGRPGTGAVPAIPVPGQANAVPGLSANNAPAGYQQPNYNQPQTYNSGVAYNNTTATAAGGAYSTPGTRQVPSRNVRVRMPDGNFSGGGGGTAPGNQMVDAPPVDPALQYLQMRADEEMARRQGLISPPVPPIPGGPPVPGQ